MNPTEADLSSLSTITAAIVLDPDPENYIGYARTIYKSEFMSAALNDLELALKVTTDIDMVVARIALSHTDSSKYVARALSWNLLNRDRLL